MTDRAKKITEIKSQLLNLNLKNFDMLGLDREIYAEKLSEIFGFKVQPEFEGMMYVKISENACLVHLDDERTLVNPPDGPQKRGWHLKIEFSCGGYQFLGLGRNYSQAGFRDLLRPFAVTCDFSDELNKYYYFKPARANDALELLNRILPEIAKKSKQLADQWEIAELEMKLAAIKNKEINK